MSGLLAFGLGGHGLLEVQLKQGHYYQDILQGLLFSKTDMFLVLSGLNWQMAERGAGRASQCLLHSLGSQLCPHTWGTEPVHYPGWYRLAQNSGVLFLDFGRLIAYLSY